MRTLWQDLRFGMRMLLKTPGFTLVVIMTLALGIGANTAIFSLVNTVLLRQLPISQADQVFDIMPLGKDEDLGAFSYPYYREVRDKNQLLEGLAAYIFAPMSLSRSGNNERLWGYLVSGNYFDLLRVRAIHGRMFTQEDDRAPGAHPVAVLSYGCWQRRFAGDPNLIGRTVTINNQSFTVVGVAPPEFKGTVLIFNPEIYVPMMMAKQIMPASDWLENPNNGGLLSLGRLKPSVTVDQAKAALNMLATQLGPQFPGYADTRFSFEPPGLISPSLRTGTLGIAVVLQSLVALALLIVCTNLANLILARAADRRREIVVRLSLGASRWRLIRQLLTESVLLALAGGAIGLLFAHQLLKLINAFKPPVDFALAIDIGIDLRVLIFTLAMSLITGALVGLLPAWQSTKQDLVSALKDGKGGGRPDSRLHQGLVVAQVTMSMVLLTAGGLIVRSTQQTQTVGPGFETDHTATVSMDLTLQGYDKARSLEFQKLLVSRIEALPGVSAASYVSYLPLNLDRSSSAIYIEGQPFTRTADLPDILTTNVWPRYFETMRIGMLEGRDFAMLDDKEEMRPAIVNESFARRFFPGQGAVGKRLSQGGPDRPFWEIVGVVRDSKYWSLGEDPQPFVYFPLLRNLEGSLALVARANSDPESLLNEIRRQINLLDPNLPLFDAKTLKEHMRLSLFPLRIGAWVAGGVATLALLIAGLGIYGVMSYATARRTHELGIRLALGAQAKDLLWLVIKRGLKLALVGVTLGLAASLALTRLLSSVLYGVSITDIGTFSVVTLLLSIVIFWACFFPARRAMKVEPTVALRYE